jgi:hypothetical protein
MSEYVVLLHADPASWRTMSPDQYQEVKLKYRNWGLKGRQSGLVVGGQKLADNAGKVIRGAKPIVMDGPYSETKEMLGGYFLIQANSYDAAAQACLDHPHLGYGGTIELREIEITLENQ